MKRSPHISIRRISGKRKGPHERKLFEILEEKLKARFQPLYNDQIIVRRWWKDQSLKDCFYDQLEA